MKQALIIIDMQNDYFSGGKMELVGTELAANNCTELLNQFRVRKLPIFHIQHISLQPGASFFLPETQGAAIHSSLAPQNSEEVIVKNFPSSFRETSLFKNLKKENIEQLIICGAMSHMCVDTTVRAAFDLGFSCIVAADGCATRSLEFNNQHIPAEQVHGAYMAALGMVFAEVITTEEVKQKLIG